jgi:hypothetical protein
MSSASRKLIQASGAVAGEAPDTGDDDFANVVLLLDGDGTSDDDNNTFTDSSTNAHTITRNGNVTQGSFSPYGDNWSNYFDGTGDYITTPATSDFNYGTGDYCLEGWLYVSSDATLYSYWMAPISTGGDGNAETDAVSIYIADGNSGSSVAGEVAVIICGNAFRLYGGTDIRGQWTHVAVTRESGTTRLFVNGQVTDSSTASYNITNPTDVGAYLGRTQGQSSYFKGYISNVRAVKGSAVYTSAFTPSTAPLTAISGTSLLICQSNRFVDESTNNHTVTINGDPKVTPFSPFKNDDARDIATDGGSGYFDTSGDTLTVPYSSTLAMGTGDCTIEAWVYFDSYPQQFSNIIDVRSSGSYGSDAISFSVENDGTFSFYAGSYNSSTHVLETASGKVTLNSWYHLVLTRVSGTTKLYVNGVEEASSTNAWNQTSGSATTLYIGGALGVTRQVNGYISNLRLVKGTAVYTSAFTPPTSPLTAVTNTELLLNFQDAGIYDRTGLNNLDTVGNASLGFAPVYGTGMLAFDGSGDYLIAGENPDLAPGAGDFTVEFWMYGVTNNFYNALYQNYTDGVSRTTALRINTNVTDQTSLMVQTAATGLITTASGVVTANAWNHVALVRNGSSLVLYVNGVSAGSTTNTTDFSDGYALIGNAAYNGTNYFFNGYIDDFRITKGVARYTSAFTPPDEIDLSSDTHAEYVTFFLDGDGTPNGQNNTFTDSSTNGFTVTKNGDVVQGVFSPYGDNWSNYFDGAGNYLTYSDDLSLRLGAGDFTIEFWINQSSKSSYQTPVAKGYISSGDYLVQTGNGDGNMVFYASGTAIATESGSTVNVGEWYHIAVVRSGTTVTIYRNGVSVATGTSSANLSTTSSLLIGQGSTYAVNGYLSNVRIVKGTALYTSAFTPSTSPFTAITNTVLLTCQSNRFKDSSIYSHTAALTGTPEVTRFSPFESNKPYDITTYGGSGYFDGASNADLVIADSNNLSPEAQDFTLEAWVYVENAGGSNKAIWSKWGSGTQEILFGISSNNLVAYISTYGVATPLLTSSTSVGSGWNHVALTRNGNAFDLWLNGVNTASATQAGSIQNQTAGVTIGDFSGGGWQYYGYMSDIRWVKGTAVYTSTFTPPTAPLTSIANTEALLSFQDSAIPDLSGLNNIDTVGNAKVGASDPTKYGSNAMEFDGTGDYLDTVSTEALTFGTGDFTIEFWINTSNNGNIMNPSTATGSGYWGLLMQSGNLRWNNSYAVTNLWQISASAIQDGSWHHVAISRASGSTKIFYDGTLQSTQADTTNYSGTGAWRIGSGNLAAFNGYLDDFRITKGVARYTANFTAPDAELPKF